MGSVRDKGTLKKWMEDKGYGFISPAKGGKDIFVHISAFDRDIPRKPKVGDTIYFHVTIDNKGKIKAVDAVIEGAAPVKRTRPPRPKQLHQRRRNKSGWKFPLLCLALMIGIGSTLYQKFQTTDRHISVSAAVSNFIGSSDFSSSSQQYACSGKTHCSQMSSCSEAKFYIQNCPGTKMDGDGDGVPCESQWCN